MKWFKNYKEKKFVKDTEKEYNKKITKKEKQGDTTRKENESNKKIDKNLTMRDNEDYFKDVINRKKVDTYSIPGVDVVSYHKPRDRIKKELLIRPTSSVCPTCKSMLYNTKLDGVHYYCPNCERQYHVTELG